MKFFRWRAFIRTVRPDFDRQQLIELVMTSGIIGMSFVLVGLMIIRLSGDAKPAAQRPKPEHAPTTVTFDHNEVKLGRFQVTMTPLTAGRDHGSVHVLQFDASVMVQNGARTQRARDAFSRYRNRLNATVDSVSRSVTEEELHDPGLDALRGRIRLRVNQLLGGNFVDDVIVSDFRYFRL